MAKREAEWLEALPRSCHVTVVVTELDTAAAAVAEARVEQLGFLGPLAKSLLKQHAKVQEEVQRSTPKGQRIAVDLKSFTADPSLLELGAYTGRL